MALREHIQNTDEYQALTEEPDLSDRDVSEPRQVETPREAVSPFISLERGDVQFWIQVLQLVLLYLILTELRRV